MLVIEMLRRYGVMSQARLKEYCDLQASTISYLVNDLKKCGLIKDAEQEQREGKVGKPGNLLALNNDMASFLGLYVEDNWIDTYWIGIDGRILEYKREKYGENSVESSIIETIQYNMSAHGSIKGIGVAVKGIVQTDGTIKSGKRYGNWDGKDAWNFEGLANDLKKQFSEIPFIVENDANCAAELFHYNTKRIYSNCVTYLLNQMPFGIGCGLILCGQLYRGGNGSAGEIFEKGGLMRSLAGDRNAGQQNTETMIQAVMPHILTTGYLLNPNCIVLTGSCFEKITDQELELIRKMLEDVPVKVEILSGQDLLNPAQGAALFAIDRYAADLVGEVTQR